MIISLKHEMVVFWAAFLCGQAVGVLFDFFRSLRKNAPHGKVLVAAEDIVFCIAAFKLFFDICYITNNGSLRWYIFASLMCSGIIYFCVMSRFVFIIWDFIFKIIRKTLAPFKKFVVFFTAKIKSVFLKLKSLVNSAFGGIGGFFVHFVKKKASKDPENKDVF